MFLQDMIDRLEAEGVGEFGVNIFATTSAQIPVSTVVSGEVSIQLIETGGTSPENFQNDTTHPAFRQPSMQITCRAQSAVLARTKAEECYAALYVRNTILSGTRYKWVKPLQEPFDSGVVDERGDARCQFNVIAAKN